MAAPPISRLPTASTSPSTWEQDERLTQGSVRSWHIRKNWGVQELDLVVISHPHLDHIEDISNFRAFNPKVLMRPNHLTDKDIMGQ